MFLYTDPNITKYLNDIQPENLQFFVVVVVLEEK